MNIDKYNFKKISEESGDVMLTQTFIDEDKHVKYIRAAWGYDIPKNELDKLTRLFELTGKLLPNVCKIEQDSNSFEVLVFEDDNVTFNSKKLLTPIIKREIESILSESSSESLTDSFYVIDKLYTKLLNSEEVSEILKFIYKDYLDKEL